VRKRQPNADIRELVSMLKRLPCVFWACEGPQRPLHMITCTKCWAVRIALDHLRSLENKPPLTFEERPENERRRDRKREVALMKRLLSS
jgi:hypothetical protein